MYRTKLFCIPHAGGSAHSYRPFQQHVGAGVEIVALELPGHGQRFAEPLLTSLARMVDDLWATVRVASGPYALFGHSMGATIAYLLALRAGAGRAAPRHLIVSGTAAPSVPYKHKGWHAQPSAEFWARITGLGGMPSEVLADEGVRVLFEPILRADFEAASGYVYPGRAGLDVPMTVLYGVDDAMTAAEANAWTEETSGPASVFRFPGGHFYYLDRMPEIGRVLSSVL
jgi:surfactin synthase thioesterase subunit